MYEPSVRSSATVARIGRLIARLPELDEQHLEGIEANLYELSELRARCTVCAYLYRAYLERCPTCSRRRPQSRRKA